ncbi:MAG: Crp/Fnr family transcriptional regulator [Hyphomicrobiales bacterium]|nr:Crp/Fnr family transcriptional regulator [Hyphomicrobiales bacterium]
MAEMIAQISCASCPLRKLPAFSRVTEGEIEFIEKFKMGELHGKAGGAIYLEGAASPHLFTLLSGWAFRYKTLPDGRRQILNYLFPGDFIGVQTTLEVAMDHGIEALTDVRLCVFSRGRLNELFAERPGLALDITWLAAREERILDDNLLAVGRRKSSERIAYLLWHLADRAAESGLLNKDGSLDLPMTQQHLADTLGLSLVTFNKTLQRLRRGKFFSFENRRLEILDEDAMMKAAAVYRPSQPTRPLI